jgi:hypothetical protein
LAGRIVAVAIQRSTGFRDELWTALLDEIAGLVNYAFENLDDLRTPVSRSINSGIEAPFAGSCWITFAARRAPAVVPL